MLSHVESAWNRGQCGTGFNCRIDDCDVGKEELIGTPFVIYFHK